MAIRLLWSYVTLRAKTFIKNYNVIDKAEKLMEKDKTAAPRHPGTETKFRVLIKGNPEFKSDLEKRPAELLDRLKIVKVTSEGSSDNPTSTRPLPQERQAVQMPMFGFEEPKIIPEGKCSLSQALGFITKHQNDPKTHSIKSIAETHTMKETDVENIVKYFHAFEIFISRDGKNRVAKSTLQSIGANKIVAPIFKTKFAHLEPGNDPDSQEKK